MRFPDRFLEDLRAALPVIDVVQRRYKLRKAGSAEWVAVDDNSLGVNTSKNVWRDFAAELDTDPLATVENLKFPHVVGTEDSGKTVYHDLSRQEMHAVDLERASGVEVQ